VRDRLRGFGAVLDDPSSTNSINASRVSLASPSRLSPTRALLASVGSCEGGPREGRPRRDCRGEPASQRRGAREDARQACCAGFARQAPGAVHRQRADQGRVRHQRRADERRGVEQAIREAGVMLEPNRWAPVKKIARAMKRTAGALRQKAHALACRSAIDGDLETGLSPRSKVQSRKAFGATAAHSTRRWHRACDAKRDPSLGGSYADTGGLRLVRRFT